MTLVAVRRYYSRHVRQLAYPSMFKFRQTVFFFCVFPLLCFNAAAEAVDQETEYARLLKVLDGLRSNNAQDEKLVANQRREIEELNNSIENVAQIQRQITPLIIRMIDALEKFIALDMPFSMGERRERVDNLRDLLDRSDVSVAEKFRLVLMAYQTESSYGSTMEVYSDLVFINGSELRVEILKVGRVALIFQTPDLKHTGIWDDNIKSWLMLGSEYAANISQAMDFVRDEKTDEFVRLPLVVK